MSWGTAPPTFEHVEKHAGNYNVRAYRVRLLPMKLKWGGVLLLLRSEGKTRRWIWNLPLLEVGHLLPQGFELRLQLPELPARVEPIQQPRSRRSSDRGGVFGTESAPCFLRGGALETGETRRYSWERKAEIAEGCRDLCLGSLMEISRRSRIWAWSCVSPVPSILSCCRQMIYIYIYMYLSLSLGL